MTIWKFPLGINDLVECDMPSGAEILCVQVQGQSACVWAKVDPAQPIVRRVFRWRGTGHPCDGAGVYVGTIQGHGGALILHLFVDAGPTPGTAGTRR